MQTSQDQQLILDTVREVMREKVAPRCAEIDRTSQFPNDLCRLFADLGLFTLFVPAEYGGIGASVTELCQVIEEIAVVDASMAVLVQCHAAALKSLLVAGNESQRRDWCRRVVDGGALFAICATEPHAGSDFKAISTRAERCGGGYRLSGQKCFVTNGGVADMYLIFARTAPQDAGHQGISTFMVRADNPGLSVGKIEDKMGLRGSSTSEIFLEQAEVSDTHRLGDEGDGFLTFMQTLETSRPCIAAQAVGLAQGAFDAALTYASQRQQFGRPIAEFQGIQFMLADMAAQIEVARAFLYQTTRRLDDGEQDVPAASAIAKLFASDMAMRVTTDAVQILGGHGYVKDYPVERMMRDAKVMQIYEGTNQIQRLVIARRLLDRQRRQTP